MTRGEMLTSSLLSATELTSRLGLTRSLHAAL
jgi:hypothetical protein